LLAAEQRQGKLVSTAVQSRAKVAFVGVPKEQYIMLHILTSCLKLKSGGNGRPFGRRAFGARSSSKKG
jgi:hypothetical protein